MSVILGDQQPILFLGLTDHWQPGTQPFPLGGVDFFQLSRHKIHVVYPGVLNASSAWVFLLDVGFMQSPEAMGTTVRITHDVTGSELGNFTFGAVVHRNTPPLEAELTPQPVPGDATKFTTGTFALLDGTPFVLLANVITGLVVPQPGRYNVTATHGDTTDVVGAMHFHYRPTSAFTPDQIKAIESNPTLPKMACIQLGCKHCESKFQVYTALQRSPKEEKQGWMWYSDIPDEFVCECGKAHISLRFVRESAHGLLLRSEENTSGLSYVRQYGHAQVQGIVNRFIELLDSQPLEQSIQSFIEKNPILLAKFHAKRLFFKPDIVGRFKADFAILDSQNELWFIEIERPSLRLFRSNAHPSADLMHAYGQVNDWLRQYAKYPGAIHEALGLRSDDILAVRGAVVAGRSASVTHEVLQRHHMAPPYPGIEFMTYDDLGSSLLTLSRKLA